MPTSTAYIEILISVEFVLVLFVCFSADCVNSKSRLACVPGFSGNTFLFPSPPTAEGRQTVCVCRMDILSAHRFPEDLLHWRPRDARFSSPTPLSGRGPQHVSLVSRAFVDTHKLCYWSSRLPLLSRLLTFACKRIFNFSSRLVSEVFCSRRVSGYPPFML